MTSIVCAANSERNTEQPFVPTHSGCRPERSSSESGPTTLWPINQSHSGDIDAATHGAARASRLLTGLQTATSRLSAGGAAASIVTSFLDSLQSELRTPTGDFQSPLQTDAEANDNAPPAEPLRDTSGRVVAGPTSTHRCTSNVPPTHSTTFVANNTELEDNVRGEQLSRSTSRSRSPSGGPSASGTEGRLCESYAPDFAQLERKKETEDMCPSTSTLRATPAGSVDPAFASTRARADAEESTLIEAFTDMLQKSREAARRK